MFAIRFSKLLAAALLLPAVPVPPALTGVASTPALGWTAVHAQAPASLSSVPRVRITANGAGLPTSIPRLEHEGAAALGVALRRLGTTKRVLMIAAHPDDENTALLAELALGDGADVAYLSLTRGEGGQNLIGPELQEGLGLIRSEELLSARRLDGARQFFTRAYDFGFAKSAEETFRHWPRDSVLADVVEIIRRYRPDIVVSVFSGTPADGHGHHQAAGMLAVEAFDAAADPARFATQLQRGLQPHRAHHLFQSMWRPPPDPPLVVATGDLDPLFGRSRHQIAMQSRSRHRSQDMGAAQMPGPQQVALRLLATSQRNAPASLFTGVDTTLLQHARAAAVPANAQELLRQYEWIVQDMRRSFNPLHVDQLVIPLADATHLLRRVQRLVPASTRSRRLHDALDDEIAKAGDALRRAAGVVVDVASSTATPVPGEAFDVAFSVWNGGASSVGVQKVVLLLPDGWGGAAPQLRLPRVLRPGEVLRGSFTVHVPAGARPTEAYYLSTPRSEGLYEWPADEALRGAGFAPAPVRLHLAMDAGTPFEYQRAAEFVEVDKSYGEVRTPLRVVPRAAVSMEPPFLVWPEGDTASRTITVRVSTAASDGIEGRLRLRAPDGFRIAHNDVPLRLQRAGEAQAIRFTVSPPPGMTGRAEFAAQFITPGETFQRGYTTIDYPHIRPHSLFRDARTQLSAFPVAIAPDLRVGYIEGAGDDGAEALRQLGARVELLDAAALANADLSVFDAIVAGIRAYEVRPDILAHNDRLLEYARRGGTFIVQYNKYEIIDGGFMPYPATMARPHGRVTDEEAPVTLLAPEHPLLAGPNRITAADFDGWVQERGLYFLDTFDDRFTPLLAMSDPGEAPLHGGLVAAQVGRGWYVYTGLALFRQLPEGVPGAYRLLANLVSLGAGADYEDEDEDEDEDKDEDGG